MNIKKELKIMRKALLILTIAILTSCAGYYKQASYVSNRSYIGMTIQEFKSVAGKKASIEAMDSVYTVYRINDYDAWKALIDTKFYYFDSNGKLVKIDGGELKQKRYQIEVINK